jgi:hypothetical protein
MNIYKWSMRHASMILFVISAVIFLIGLGQAILALKNTGGDAIVSGEPISAGLMSFLMLLTGTFTALSSAAIPYIGAVFINRWDRRNS